MFRKLIKKLNNFRFTSICAACVSGLAAVYGLVSFALFHFAGELLERDENIRAVGFYDHKLGGYLSFVVFLGFVVTVICGIVVAYSMIPFIKNKEKLLPRKGVLLVGFVGAFFEILLIVMMVLLALQPDRPKTFVGILVSLPFGIVSAVGQLFYLVPYLKCNFFMPEVDKK